MGRVVALLDDLFFQMKLAETAKQLGVEVKVATNGEALLGLMASEPKLVIVDLNAHSQPIAAKLPCTIEEFLVAQGLLPRNVVVRGV